MAENDGGPRIWNRGDIKRLVNASYAGVQIRITNVEGCDGPVVLLDRLFSLMELVESMRVQTPERDDKGRFLPPPRLPASTAGATTDA